jgi:hypothetical protein
VHQLKQQRLALEGLFAFQLQVFQYFQQLLVSVKDRLSVFQELWLFMKHRKKFWLGPIMFVLLLLGALIVFTEGSALAPFIYALF